MTADDPVADPRGFIFPFLGGVFLILLCAEQTDRPLDRWAALCFLVCATLILHHRLPEAYPDYHPFADPQCRVQLREFDAEYRVKQRSRLDAI